jgi:tetratricopeptide (TPR) repeat protein
MKRTRSGSRPCGDPFAAQAASRKGLKTFPEAWKKAFMNDERPEHPERPESLPDLTGPPSEVPPHMTIVIVNRYIEDGEVLKAMDSFKAIQSGKVATPEYANTALRLVVALRKQGYYPEAREIYASMNSLGMSEEASAVRARAAFNLFESYRKSGMLKEAEEMLAAMAQLNPSDDVKLLRAMATVNLVEAQVAARDLPAARRIFESMELLGESEELNLIRATAALGLLKYYDTALEYRAGLEIFKTVKSLGDYEDVAIMVARASVLISQLAVKAGDVPRAKSVFTDLGSLVESWPELWSYRDEVFSVIYEATGETDF